MTKPLKNPFEEHEEWKPFLESDVFYQKSKSDSFQKYLSQYPIAEVGSVGGLKALASLALENLNKEKASLENALEKDGVREMSDAVQAGTAQSSNQILNQNLDSKNLNSIENKNQNLHQDALQTIAQNTAQSIGQNTNKVKNQEFAEIKIDKKEKQTENHGFWTNLRDSYLNFVHSVTQNAILATMIMLIALTTVSASAAQILAPEEFKPSTLANNFINDPESFFGNLQKDKNPYSPLLPDSDNHVVSLDACDLSIKYPKVLVNDKFRVSVNVQYMEIYPGSQVLGGATVFGHDWEYINSDIKPENTSFKPRPENTSAGSGQSSTQTSITSDGLSQDKSSSEQPNSLDTDKNFSNSVQDSTQENTQKTGLGQLDTTIPRSHGFTFGCYDQSYSLENSPKKDRLVALDKNYLIDKFGWFITQSEITDIKGLKFDNNKDLGTNYRGYNEINFKFRGKTYFIHLQESAPKIEQHLSERLVQGIISSSQSSVSNSNNPNSNSLAAVEAGQNPLLENGQNMAASIQNSESNQGFSKSSSLNSSNLTSSNSNLSNSNFSSSGSSNLEASKADLSSLGDDPEVQGVIKMQKLGYFDFPGIFGNQVQIQFNSVTKNQASGKILDRPNSQENPEENIKNPKNPFPTIKGDNLDKKEGWNRVSMESCDLQIDYPVNIDGNQVATYKKSGDNSVLNYMRSYQQNIIETLDLASPNKPADEYSTRDRVLAMPLFHLKTECYQKETKLGTEFVGSISSDELKKLTGWAIFDNDLGEIKLGNTVSGRHSIYFNRGDKLYSIFFAHDPKQFEGKPGIYGSQVEISFKNSRSQTGSSQRSNVSNSASVGQSSQSYSQNLGISSSQSWGQSQQNSQSFSQQNFSIPTNSFSSSYSNFSSRPNSSTSTNISSPPTVSKNNIFEITLQPRNMNGVDKFVSEHDPSCDSQMGIVRYQKLDANSGEYYSMLVNNKNISTTTFYNNAQSRLDRYLNGSASYTSNMEDYFMDFCRTYTAEIITEINESYPNTDLSKAVYTKSKAGGIYYPVVVVYAKKGDNYISLAAGAVDSNKITRDLDEKCGYAKNAPLEFYHCWDYVLNTPEYKELARKKIQQLTTTFALDR